MRRRSRIAVVAVLLAGALLPVLAAPALARTAHPAAAAVPSPAAAEADFVARINGLRASRGLGPLSVDPELTAAARSWASVMAGEGRIFHASDLSAGVTTRWAKLGENVGVGGDVASLFQAFVDSPSHLANLVDPAYSRVGVGVVVSGNRIYTAHRFMAVAAPPPTTTAPPPPPTSAPPPTAPPTTAAPTTTVPPTTTTSAPPTTTPPPRPPSKLGPLEELAALVERG